MEKIASPPLSRLTAPVARSGAMRICLVTPYDLACDGGVNRHVVALSHALRRLGHEVQVLGPTSGLTPPQCDGLPGVVGVSANGSIARVGLFVSRRAVRRYLDDGCFDVVHVHEPWVPGITRHTVDVVSAPLVGTFHAYAEHEPLATRILRWALARPLRRLRCAIAVSAAAAEFARDVFRGPVQLVPNGIDGASFARTSPPVPAPTPVGDGDADDRSLTTTGAASEPLRLLFVGRYDEPRKGLRFLLAAAALIRARGREVDVQIVGHGDPAPLAALARQAGGRFLGRLSDGALAEAYHRCDVFCAPSTHGESFGLVLIEAMACGRPVVASDIRGYREASAGAALLVPPADPAALAHAILRAADDTRLRSHLVASGNQRARQLAWSRLALEIGALYETAMTGVVRPRRTVEVSA